MSGPRVALAPAGSRSWLADAIRAGGGELVDPDRAEAIVWAEPSGAHDLVALLVAAPGIKWVQLPWAGIEPFVEVLDDDHVWTCGKGVYAEPVAEHALALLLAGMRGAVRYARTSEWSAPWGRNLLHANVTVLGGGAITESLLRLLGPFGTSVTVVRRHPEPLDGAASVVGIDGFADALAGADALVLALALTPETAGIVGAAELASLPAHAWVVNVARGRHIVTDDLVAALRDERIGGAALDVTDPEPLPAAHPLWAFPNCLITPHTANTPEMAVPLLAARIEENVRRYSAGDPLLGPVDARLGY